MISPALLFSLISCYARPTLDTAGLTADDSPPPPDALEACNPSTFLRLTSPVDTQSLDLSSAFGFRLKASENYRPDFHTGIDIPETIGDPVYAVADGTIYSVHAEGDPDYPEGGNVVLIEHGLEKPCLFHDQVIDTVYSEYMHLDSFEASAKAYLNTESQSSVLQGEIIGAAGDSGETHMPHLHCEIRMGTTCSLEYQLNHPDLDCANFGFDPHINPMTFYVDGLSAENFSIDLGNITNTSVDIVVTAHPNSLIVDGVTFEIFSSDGATKLYMATMSFDQRTGFDATSSEALDNPDIEGFTISPAAFNSSSELYEITFAADIPDPVWMDRNEILIRATLLTTMGEAAQIEQTITR